MSTLTVTPVSRPEALDALTPEWESLAASVGDGNFFRGPRWLVPWFHAYREVLSAQLLVLGVRDGNELVGVAALYESPARLAPGVRTRELRMLGDAGPRPPALDFLVRPSYDEAFGHDVAAWLTQGEGAQLWDSIDLAPLKQVSRARAFLAERLDAAGRKVESHEASGSLSLGLSKDFPIDKPELPHGMQLRLLGAGEREKGLAALRRLSRLEWASREETSPFADAQALGFLEHVIASLHDQGKSRFVQIDDARGDAMAVAVVLDDSKRAVCLTLASDPERDAGALLLAHEAAEATARGLKSLELVIGAWDPILPPLAATVRKTLRLKIFNQTAAGAVARTYTKIRRSAEAALDVPGAAAAGARSAWSKIREAAHQVATVERLHLYRGELWTRGIRPPIGLAIRAFTEADFDGLPLAEQQDLASRLELDEVYCHEKWARGDLVVLATLEERAAGIAWCARSEVNVPELERVVRPGAYECYIHDVFVAPDARGRNVAPIMLEALARELRARDVYRAWALIRPDNVASTRAFEKAAYTSVADVIYAKVAGKGRVVLRPSDADGRRLLGAS